MKNEPKINTPPNKLQISPVYFHTNEKAGSPKSHRTGGETRTPDTWFWRPVLYQLSYTRKFSGCKGKDFY